MRIFIILCFVTVMVTGCGCGKKDIHTEPEHDEEGIVRMSEASRKLIDFEVLPVHAQPFRDFIEVSGEIAKETETVAHVTSPEPGILKAFFKEIGATVEKGTPLASVETKGGKTIPLDSTIHGIVMARYVKPGESVDQLTSIVTVADPDLLRASFNVYEKDISKIKLGQKVRVGSVAYPDQHFEGAIVFISPSVDETTRTIKIRVQVKNEEHLLKFGMFVTGQIEEPSGEPVFVIPHDAVQTLEAKTVVFVQDEQAGDEFHVREIRPGRQSEEQIEVLEGLGEGEKVVGRGSFYLKSELMKEELHDEHGH
ncbi:MAG: efflux RND transporter periplasmic adaptor subunit [Candidatus Omnitrophica bacterium]|nr:efflux RND transporter periplasmic adaptor subunit [Candidatus Omnitrophota bacterium]